MAHLSNVKIRTIMKTTDGTDLIGLDALFLTARATELFIKQLASQSVEDAKLKGSNKLMYSNLVNVVHGNHKYEFIEHMFPHKITVKQYKAIMAKKANKNSDESSSSEEEDDDESGSEDSSSADDVKKVK